MDVQAVIPFVNDADFQLYVGDVRDCLRELPDGSVHCCVTSPPYWGLRDYGAEGQIGLEPTPEAFVAAMVDVFREVRRVLRDDGTLWLNLGDSYNTSASGATGADSSTLKGYTEAQNPSSARRRDRFQKSLKPKDLVGIPWRVAFALQADGWYLRSDIIWAKPNPMPESVTDRPTKAHEYLFLLTKSPRYFFDQEAVREPHSPDGRKVSTRTVANGSHNNYQEFGHEEGRERWPNGGRNVRSVWEIATQPYPDAHFATFPEALPDRCIRAGTSERGCCPECGAPWEREVETTRQLEAGRKSLGIGYKTTGIGPVEGVTKLHHDVTRETIGWCPSCGCGDDQGQFWPIPCTVLDPFMGSGTTALVARRLGRRSIGLELNEEYARLCARRLQQLSLLSVGEA